MEPDSERASVCHVGQDQYALRFCLRFPIGAEVYLGQDWSVAADWMYGWWSNRGKHRYWRLWRQYRCEMVDR